MVERRAPISSLHFGDNGEENVNRLERCLEDGSGEKLQEEKDDETKRIFVSQTCDR